MKLLLVSMLMLVLLTACGETTPPFTDNGNPGQIQLIVFYDDNKNGRLEEGEPRVQAQAIVGISQEVSCPPSSKPSYIDTDANGQHNFNNLKPGKYCLYLNNGFLPTTRLTQEVYVSSDMVTITYFGLAK